MSDQSILQIDTDEELARVMRQLKTLPQQLGAPNVLKNALNSTARKVRRQIIKDSKGRYALKEKKALQSESKILSASASTLEAAVLAAASAVTALLARRLTRPLAVLTDAGQQIAAGDYARRTALHTGQAIGHPHPQVVMAMHG